MCRASQGRPQAPRLLRVHTEAHLPQLRLQHGFIRVQALESWHFHLSVSRCHGWEKLGEMRLLIILPSNTTSEEELGWLRPLKAAKQMSWEYEQLTGRDSNQCGASSADAARKIRRFAEMGNQQ